MRGTIAITCFFLSGAAGLIYEVVWIRMASQVFGSTTFAVSLVLAVFFLGLALGSEAAGRLAGRTSRPLRVYAFLELALALFAALTPMAFRWCEVLYSRLYPDAMEDFRLLTLLRSVLMAVILLVPAMAMGATLPLFARQFVRRRAGPAGSVGSLYAINTAGAAAGCALAGLVLIPQLGLTGSIAVGVAINLAIAALVLWLYRDREPVSDPSRSVAGAPGLPQGTGLVAVLFFLVGFSALGYEVLWTRFLGLFLSNTVYTYTLTLTIVLAGIALGSLLAALLFDRVRSPWAWFGTVQILSGLAVVVAMTLPPEVWRSLRSEFWAYAALLFVPSLLSGTAFPLAVRLVVPDPARAASGTGRLYAVNTLGGIAGALLLGFVVVPQLGMEAGLRVTTGAAFGGGLIGWWAAVRREGKPRWSLAIPSVLVAAGVMVVGGTGRKLPQDFLVERGEVLLDYREGLTATLAVIQEERGRRLEMDQWWQGASVKNHQSIAAHIPALLHGEARRILVVGAGAGQTPQRFLMHGIDRLDCVDIEPAVFDLIREHFGGAWTTDARVELLHEDGRSFVSYTRESYDVISLEVGQVFRPAAASLYTVEFYEKARRRLARDGLVCQFVPLPFFTRGEFCRIVATFLAVFPESLLWYNTSELILIGFRDGVPKLDRTVLAERMQRDEVARDLEFSYWGGPSHWLSQRSNFLAGFLVGPAGLDRLAGDAERYTDERPELEYSTSKPGEERTEEESIIAMVGEHLTPVGAILAMDPGPDELARIAQQRQRNLGDIVTAARLREVKGLIDSGDYERVAGLLREGVRANPENRLARQLLADTHMMLGQPEAAEDHYRVVLEIDSSDVPSHRGLAYLLHRRGALDEAIEHYHALLREEPDEARTHFALGLALAGTGESALALHHLETAAGLEPGFEEARRQADRVRAALNSLDLPGGLELFDPIPLDSPAP